MTATADTAGAATGVLVLVLVALALHVWTALALAAVFRKSGEAAWKAWVPLLNQAVILRLGGRSPFLLLIYLVPVVGVLVVWISQTMACHRINVAFKVGPGMTVLAALLLPVWASILGFGSSRWVGEEAGPRRLGDTAEPERPVIPSLYDPSVPVPPIPPSRSSDDDAPFHGRSTHVKPEDPAFEQAPDAVAPPAPAPGRPTPFAPSAAGVDPEEGPVAPRAGRSGSPVSPPPGGWSLPEPAAADGDGEGDIDIDADRPLRRRSTADVLPDDFDEVTAAVPGAPEPMSAVPRTHLPPVTRVPAMIPPPADGDEPWAPSRSESDAFADTSGPVSAIVGAPDAGAPRSARSSVSAQSRRAQIPDEAFDETIIARRRRTDWSLVPPDGSPIAIGADVVLLGRRPASDPQHPGAQLISIDDGTVSKTHALLILRDERWYITDLASTNGVVFATLMGTEVEATPGVETEAGDRFLLGDAEVRLVRSGE